MTVSTKEINRVLVKPLCKATEKLFADPHFQPTDRLSISLDKTGEWFEVSAYRADIGMGRGFASFAASNTWVARMPERKNIDSQHGRWAVATTDFNALIINSLWQRNHITFTDSALEVFNYLLLRFVRQTQLAKERAEFKLNKAAYLVNTSMGDRKRFIDHRDRPLADFQLCGLRSSVDQEGFALFMEQGTGKTPIVISRICNEARALRRGKVNTVALQKTVSQIKAKLIVDIRMMVEQTDRCAVEELKRAEARLKNEAQKTSDGMMVKVDFEGTPRQALEHTRLAVQKTEDWLANRLQEIGSEIAELYNEINIRIEDEKKTHEADLRLAANAAINKIKVPHKKPATRMYRVLVVAPKNVRTNWRNEYQRFATVPGKVTILRGGALKRMKQLVEAFADDDDDCEWTCVVCSYETLRMSWEYLQMVEWDLAVLDESHYVKSARTQRWKTTELLRDKCEQRMALTGTPITNTLFDLFTQLEWLGKGLSGFSTFKAFKKYYGTFVKRGKFTVLTEYKNLPLIQERLNRLAYMITKKEAMPDLPSKLPDVVEVEMGSEQRKYYCDLRDQLMIEAEQSLENADKAGKPRSIVTNNILVKFLRLAQITSGFIVWDAEFDDNGDEVEGKQIDRIDPNPKLEALVELLKNKGPDDKTIVWACWVQDLRSIAARLRLEGIDCETYYGATKEDARERAVTRFNEDPKCKVFIGNPAAGGTGLNLLGYSPDKPEMTTNCNHEVYYSQNWSPTARSQSEDRAHRRGTRVNVRITDLCISGTIDEEIRTRVCTKRMSAYSLQDVRGIMQRLLELTPEIGD